MAYSSNFNLDSDDGRRPSRPLRDATRRRVPSGSDGPSRASARVDASAPRTTNRITVSGRDAHALRRDGTRPSAASRSTRTSTSPSRSLRMEGDGSRVQDRRRPASSASNARSQNIPAGDARSGRRARPAPAPASPAQSGVPAASSGTTRVFDVLKLIAMGILRLLAFIGRGVARGFRALWNKSRVAGGAVVVAAVLLCGFMVDSALTAEKIYQGVYVGDVNVAGMTQTEAADAISARYGDKLENTSVYIFTSEEAARDTDVDQVQVQEEMLAEQISVEDALESKVLWVESSSTLGARLPVQELAAEAYEFGRSTGLLDRFSTLMRTHEIEARLDYNPAMLSKLVSDLNTAIGSPAQEYGLSVQDGVATVVEGHDGYEIDEGAFQATLTDKLLNSEVDDPRYIPVAEYVSLKVDAAAAQQSADAVNEALQEGASFDYGSSSADISKEALGSWVEAEPAERNGGWYLKPRLSEEKALETLTENLNLDENGGSYTVTFQVEGDGVAVMPSQEVTIPNVGSALQGLDEALFGSFCETGVQKVAGERYGIQIQTQQSQGPLSLGESLAYGVVTAFSTYTTQFTSTNSTLNRMYNIQKAADLIDDSVIAADGGRWSFNESAGDCNAEAGFKEAGVISGDEMTQEAGGGVCQVATTVFNAVYESGLPIVERHNHTLSSSSYPAGRDAAIAYPTLDLIWENDTPSDILLTTSYTSSSITVHLIGQDPGLEVITDTGDWEEGDPYKIKVEVDETYSDNAVVKMTNGSDGKTINVTRTVKDADGNVVDQQTFSSIYSPVNEVYKVGPKVDTAEIQRKYARQEGADDATSSSTSGSSGSGSSSSNGSGSSSASSSA